MSDTTVRCATCRAFERVDFSKCLRNGWPKHCGDTMQLETYPKPDGIATATRKAIDWQLRYGGDA